VWQRPLPRAVRAFCLGLPILLMFHLPAQAQTKQTPTQPAAAKQATARKDLLGDPLPDGAIARLGTLRLRHQDTVGALAFTLDGRMLASASSGWSNEDRTIRLWSTVTGQELHRFPGPRWGSGCFAFSPDGKTLATCGERYGSLHFWDVASGKERHVLASDEWGSVTALTFSLDGQALASAWPDGTIHLWDVAKGK